MIIHPPIEQIFIGFHLESGILLHVGELAMDKTDKNPCPWKLKLWRKKRCGTNIYISGDGGKASKARGVE